MSLEDDDYDFLFKVVIVGDSHVGKTQILSRFITNQFTLNSKPTVGVEFGMKTIKVGDVLVKNQIWDTAGQQKFRALTCAYYRGAVGAIVVFDLTKSLTFQHVQRWIKEIKQNSEPEVTVLLVGNKSDLLEHEVKAEDIQNFASDHKLLYIQTSAATGQNVHLVFETLVKQILETVNPSPRIDFEIQQEDEITHTPIEKQGSHNAPQSIENSPQKIQNPKSQKSVSKTTEKGKAVPNQKPKIQTFSIEQSNQVKLKSQSEKEPKAKKKCC